VPRAKDVGMLHDYGFSVTIHSKDGVQAITTPYLTSEDLLSERAVRSSDLERFEGDAGLLFRQTTLLEGYSAGKKAREQVATAASDAKDWGRAAALWNALREEFPEEPRYWLKAGEALCEAKTIEPAERLLDEAVRRFPQHNWLSYRHIRVAHEAGKWDEAVERAERLRKEAPDFWPGWVAGVDALVMLRRADEAKDLARRAVSRFPDEFWPNYWLARLTAADTDRQSALQVWTALVNRFPDDTVAVAALKSASGNLSDGKGDAPS
jgi:predicted Zn-dependent protease